MIEINTVPNLEAGLNISKVVVQLNSVNDSPYQLQYAVTGFGKVVRH